MLLFVDVFFCLSYYNGQSFSVLNNFMITIHITWTSLVVSRYLCLSLGEGGGGLVHTVCLSDCIVHVVVTYIVPPLYIVLSVFYSKLFFSVLICSMIHSVKINLHSGLFRKFLFSLLCFFLLNYIFQNS